MLSATYFLNQETSPMNLWIMSRLAAAVEMTNKGFENYDLNASTTACYNLWLYDLCDIYLVTFCFIFTNYVSKC